LTYAAKNGKIFTIYGETMKNNTYWSQYVQYTEELYRSRALRFTEGNKDAWLGALGVADGDRVLEIGCGGGTFCNRIKQFLPKCTVTGVDLDSGHIAWAQNKAAELKLDVTYMEADALALPFADATFDVCFSHTVIDFCQPTAFVAEQRRVLKNGGRLVILNGFGGNVSTRNNAELWQPTESDGEEYELFNRLWEAASGNQLSDVKRYNITLADYPKLLSNCGFTDIDITPIAAAYFNPDSASVDEAVAVEMIEVNRLSELCSVAKAKAMAADGLTDAEYNKLVELINSRYDQQRQDYRQGKQHWDFFAALTIAVGGKK
jgi:SAM-dependent methyltransferase